MNGVVTLLYASKLYEFPYKELSYGTNEVEHAFIFQ